MVYCPAPYSKKQSFWDQLMKITETYPEPSLAIGDFNSILTQSEKQGGKPFA